MSEQISTIVEILKNSEEALSDGYGYYCGHDHVDMVLENIAESILIVVGNEQAREIERLRQREAEARAIITEGIAKVDQLNKVNADLLAACEQAQQLLTALRMDSGVGNILTELYRLIDEQLIAAITKAKGGD